MKRQSNEVHNPTIAIAFLGTMAISPIAALADEGGVSFWLPGQFGSLAAVPQQPGWSFADVYYHTSVAPEAMSRRRASWS
jgi:hypothetical protein